MATYQLIYTKWSNEPFCTSYRPGFCIVNVFVLVKSNKKKKVDFYSKQTFQVTNLSNINISYLTKKCILMKFSFKSLILECPFKFTLCDQIQKRTRILFSNCFSFLMVFKHFFMIGINTL